MRQSIYLEGLDYSDYKSAFNMTSQKHNNIFQEDKINS